MVLLVGRCGTSGLRSVEVAIVGRFETTVEGSFVVFQVLAEQSNKASRWSVAST